MHSFGNLAVTYLLPAVLAHQAQNHHHHRRALATNDDFHNTTWPTAASSGLWPMTNQSVAAIVPATSTAADTETLATTVDETTTVTVLGSSPSSSLPLSSNDEDVAAAQDTCANWVTVTVTTTVSATVTVEETTSSAASSAGTESASYGAATTYAPSSSTPDSSTPASAPSSAASSPATPAATAQTSYTSATSAAASPEETSSSTSAPGGYVAPAGKPKRGIISGDPLTSLMKDNPKMGIAMSWNERFQVENPPQWAFIRLMMDLTPDVDDKVWSEIMQQGVTETTSAKILCGGFEDNTTPLASIVSAWKKYIEPWNTQYQVIGPMIGANASFAKEFEEMCVGCPLEGSPLAFTTYSSGDDPGFEAIKRSINDYATTFPGRKLWAANVGMLSGSNGTPEYLMKLLVPWLDANDNVEYYMWNSGGGNADVFVDYSTNGLSALGQLYATL